MCHYSRQRKARCVMYEGRGRSGVSCTAGRGRPGVSCTVGRGRPGVSLQQAEEGQVCHYSRQRKARCVITVGRGRPGVSLQ